MIKEFIPQLLMFFSATAVLVIVGRKVSTSLKDLEKEEIGNKIDLELERKEIKDKIVNFLEKILRKTKIALQKSDTKLMEFIKYLQIKRGGEEKPVENDEIAVGAKEVTEQIPKKPILKKVTGLKARFIHKTSLNPIISLKKKKPAFKSKQVERTIDIEGAKKAMIEQQERKLIKKISLNPKDDMSYIELGKLYLKIENIEDAKASFKQALKINKGNVAAKKLLKEIGDHSKPI